MFKQNKSAFTLIELLVVVAIIGILATFAAVSLQNARARARDAKRVSDIKQIQTALELYFNNHNEYPIDIIDSISSGDAVYMMIVPTAPSPPDGSCDFVSNQYLYSSPDSGSYTLSFCLGSDTSNLSAGVSRAIPGGIVRP